MAGTQHIELYGRYGKKIKSKLELNLVKISSSVWVVKHCLKPHCWA